MRFRTGTDVSEFRPKLTTISGHIFTVFQMRELCKCETDRDAKRVAKKAIALAKKTGERVTAKLIAIVRDDAGETGAAVGVTRSTLEGTFDENGNIAKLGKTEQAAAEITGLDESTLRTFSSVAGRFELLLRNNKLTYNHHKEVASVKEIHEDSKTRPGVTDTWQGVFRGVNRCIWGFMVFVSRSRFNAENTV